MEEFPFQMVSSTKTNALKFLEKYKQFVTSYSSRFQHSFDSLQTVSIPQRDGYIQLLLAEHSGCGLVRALNRVNRIKKRNTRK